MTIKLLTLVLALLLGHRLTASDYDHKPNQKPKLSIPFSNESIKIDGNLNDPLWNNAVKANNFTEFTPNDGNKPLVSTEVLVAYDMQNLYVAFICQDDPNLVRASLQDRDNIWSDDYVGILIDTYGNSNWAYYLFANPLGIQGDSRFSTTSGEDEGFDVIYTSEGQITNSGFQVEMAIPFSSLRFPDTDVQNWRINFWRNHPRESRFRYSWSSISRDDPCFLCQYGEMEGLKNIKPASSLEILPYAIGSQAGRIKDFNNANSGFKNNDIEGTAGFNLKWAATPSLTVEGTYNPDFSQVESDAGQIDVNNTFALFFPERRPFFQEGSDLFRTWTDIVYTRSINNPVVATKIIGRWDKSTLAYMSAYDEETPLILPFEERSRFVEVGNSLSNIIRFKQQFGENNFIGTTISDRRLDDGGVLNYSVDGLYRFGENYQIEFQAVGSQTNEPKDTLLTSGINDILFDNKSKSAAFDGESFAGNALYASFERNARYWNLDLDYRETSPSFRSGNGFITQNDNRRLLVWTGYTFYFEDHPIFNQIQPFVHSGRLWNFNGLVKDEWINPGIYFNLKGQTNAEIAYTINNENFSGKQFNSINRINFYIDSRFSEILSLGLYIRAGNYIDRGNLVKGHGIQTFESWATIKPLSNFIIQPSFVYAELIRNDNDKVSFAGGIWRVRFNYQFTREFSLRLVTEYNRFSDNFSLEPLFSYKINPFTIFYAGMTQNKQNYTDKNIYQVNDWTTTSRQFFMKFQYLFTL